jgi:RNA polymerase sigma-70 factor (ECF subfamily)
MARARAETIAQLRIEERPGRDDAELVRQAQRDLDAFVALYDRYVEAVFRYCSRRLPRAAAEDATSVTFLNAIGAIRGLAPERHHAFRAWLFTIAHNAVVDQLRKQPHLPIDDLEFAEPGPSLDDRVVLSDRRERLAWAIGTLGPEQQQVIHLRLAGLQTNEISEALGKSPGAVRVIHHRAVNRLRELMDDSELADTERTESR